MSSSSGTGGRQTGENRRWRAFAQRIVWHRDTAAEAYRQAGFKAGSPSVATTNGAALLAKPAVQAMIAEEEARLAERMAVTEDRIVRELAAVAFADPLDLVAWGRQTIQANEEAVTTAHLELRESDEIPAHVRAAIKSVKVTRQGVSVELHDKLAALGHLAKVKGMVVDRSEVSGPGGGAVPVEHSAGPQFGDLIERLRRGRDGGAPGA